MIVGAPYLATPDSLDLLAEFFPHLRVLDHDPAGVTVTIAGQRLHIPTGGWLVSNQIDHSAHVFTDPEVRQLFNLTPAPPGPAPQPIAAEPETTQQRGAA